MACLKELIEEAFRCLGVSGLTQHELQGAARGVHRSIQILPLTLHFDVGLVYPPGVVGRLQVGLAAFL